MRRRERGGREEGGREGREGEKKESVGKSKKRKGGRKGGEIMINNFKHLLLQDLMPQDHQLIHFHYNRQLV